MNTLTATERIVYGNGKRLIIDAFDKYVVFRDSRRVVIFLADAKIGENLYDTKNNAFVGYCPDSFDAELALEALINIA